MERIRCDVDESPAALEHVRAAVARCCERGAELELVGVVRTSMLDAPQPAYGERVRHFNQVQSALVQSIRIARSAGIAPTVTVRVGRPERPFARWSGAIPDVAGALKRAQRRIAAAGRRPTLWHGRRL